MKKGFTLIELLAVIVVLAILALIVVPIVTSIIKEAQTASDERSIEQYAKIIKDDYLQKRLSDSSLTFENYLNDIGSTATPSYNGDTVDCEQYSLAPNNEVELLNCRVENREWYHYIDGKVTKGDKRDLGESEDEPSVEPEPEPEKVIVVALDALNPVCTLVNDADSNGRVTPGDEYTCEVKEGTNYTFFVLDVEESKVDLILDRNIHYDSTEDVGKLTDSTNKGLVTWDGTHKCHNWYCKDVTNSSGPINSMNYLYNATKDWINIPNIVMDYSDEGYYYEYGSIVTENNITKITRESGSVTAQYENLKARLPERSEVYGKCGWGSGSCPLWLVNYLHQSEYVLEGINIEGIYGYWTLSSCSNDGAFYISNDGNTTYGKIYSSTDCVEYSTGGSKECERSKLYSDKGVRPVISFAVTSTLEYN